MKLQLTELHIVRDILLFQDPTPMSSQNQTQRRMESGTIDFSNSILETKLTRGKSNNKFKGFSRPTHLDPIISRSSEKSTAIEFRQELSGLTSRLKK